MACQRQQVTYVPDGTYNQAGAFVGNRWLRPLDGVLVYRFTVGSSRDQGGGPPTLPETPRDHLAVKNGRNLH
jgi:hypothetical protein